MADSHKKKTAKEAISNEQEAKGKYSPSELRKHMSTGGGEPIDAGKKWTTERRVLQPRDPDTGHFTYNADAQLGLKYKQRAKGAIPVGAKGWILNNGIKKGDKVVIDDSVWIAIEGIDKQKLIDYFKKYDEAEGEYYVEEDGKATGLSSEFVGKRGRKSKEEKKAIDEYDEKIDEIAKGNYDEETADDTWRIVGDVDISSLGNYTQEEIKEKFEEKATGFEKNEKLTQLPASIGIQKKADNEAHNKKVDEENKAKAEAEKAAQEKKKPEEKVGIPNNAGAGQGGVPNVAGAGQGSGEQMEETKKTEVTETYKPDIKNIVANPKQEYENNKEYWDKKVQEYNQQHNSNHSAAWLLQALAQKYGKKK